MGAAAAFRAIENGRRLAADIAQAREGWNGKVTARADNAVWKVMDLLERQPVVTARVLDEELGLSATTAWRAMGRLEGAGVVVGVDKHRMGRNWRSEEVLRRSTSSRSARDAAGAATDTPLGRTRVAAHQRDGWVVWALAPEARDAERFQVSAPTCPTPRAMESPGWAR